MNAEGKLSSLWKTEDWWAVWFGFMIILVAFLGFLGNAPKLGEWIERPTAEFYSYERSVPLEQPIEGLEIPDGFKKRIKYDEDEGLLIYKGLMTAKQRNQLKKFSSDPAYIEAVDRLYDTPPTPTGSIFVKLLILYVTLGGLTAIGIWAMGGDPYRYLGAFAVVFVLAIVSYTFAHQHTIKTYGLGYAFWALIIGLLVSNTIGTPKWLMAGVKTEMFIKTGLVLLGAEILFSKILELGAPGLFVAWIVTPTVIVFMYFFGTRVMKMTSKALVIIVAAATSVCGVSAAIATAAACRAKKEELTLAVGMTLIFTVLMMIFMPMAIKAVGMNIIVGGAWMGGTIDATGAVVAAGSMLGPEPEKVAAVVKMIQNVLIGVVAFIVAVLWVTRVERDASGPKPTPMEIWYRFPKFIVGFVAASLVFSFILVPSMGMAAVEKNIIGAATKTLRGWLFCLAFVSIGLESNFRELAKQMAGGKPIVLYFIGQSFNLVLTLLMAYLAFGGILFGEF